VGWLANTKAGRLSIIALTCIAGVAFAFWMCFRPKIGHASLLEIRAVLPRELRYRQPLDPNSVDRMDRLIAIAKRLRRNGAYTFRRDGTQSFEVGGPPFGVLPELSQLADAATAPNDSIQFAKAVWRTRRPIFQEIAEILDEGDLQYRILRDSDADRSFVLDIRDFVRWLAIVGVAFAQAGDFEVAQNAIDQSHRLAAAVASAGGDSLNYLGATGMLSDSDNAILCTSLLPRCPKRLIQTWLDDLTPFGKQPSALARALAEDFRELKLPLIADPKKLCKALAAVLLIDADPTGEDVPASHESYEGYGTYDPVATAKAAGRIVLHNIASADLPFDSYTGGPLDPAFSTMPDYGGLGMKPGWRLSWEKIKFRYLMSNSPNTLGRGLLQLGGPPDFSTMLKVRCAYQARHEETRIALASVLFRRKHGGKLPHVLADLDPGYLPVLPYDPFTGNAILYNPIKEVVWCASGASPTFDEDAIAPILDTKTVTTSLKLEPNPLALSLLKSLRPTAVLKSPPIASTMESR